MANEIPVDEAAVHATLDAIAGEYIPHGEASPGGPTFDQAQGEPQGATMDWTAPAGLLVMIFDRVVAPNWQLEPEEKSLLHEQTVVTLQAFFPTVQMDPRWAALLSLGGAFVVVAGKRIDPETGRIRPLHVKPDPDDGTNTAAA